MSLFRRNEYLFVSSSSLPAELSYCFVWFHIFRSMLSGFVSPCQPQSHLLCICLLFCPGFVSNSSIFISLIFLSPSLLRANFPNLSFPHENQRISFPKVVFPLKLYCIVSGRLQSTGDFSQVLQNDKIIFLWLRWPFPRTFWYFRQYSLPHFLECST